MEYLPRPVHLEKIHVVLKKLKRICIFIPFIVFLLGKSTQKQINESMEFQVVLHCFYKTK